MAEMISDSSRTDHSGATQEKEQDDHSTISDETDLQKCEDRAIVDMVSSFLEGNELPKHELDDPQMILQDLSIVTHGEILQPSTQEELSSGMLLVDELISQECNFSITTELARNEHSSGDMLSSEDLVALSNMSADVKDLDVLDSCNLKKYDSDESNAHLLAIPNPPIREFEICKDAVDHSMVTDINVSSLSYGQHDISSSEHQIYGISTLNNLSATASEDNDIVAKENLEGNDYEARRRLISEELAAMGDPENDETGSETQACSSNKANIKNADNQEQCDENTSIENYELALTDGGKIDSDVSKNTKEKMYLSKNVEEDNEEKEEGELDDDEETHDPTITMTTNVMDEVTSPSGPVTDVDAATTVKADDNCGDSQTNISAEQRASKEVSLHATIIKTGKPKTIQNSINHNN